MIRKHTNKLVVLLLFFFLLSCSKEKEDNNTSLDCSTVSDKAFAANISPLVQSRCATAGCHAAGSTNGPGALTNYSQIFNARAAIRASVSSGSMPKGSTLTTAQKNSILCWIDGGAPNN